MKVFLNQDKNDYLEVKGDGEGCVDLSIRTLNNQKTSFIITAKLNTEVLDKIIANLILLKSQAINETK